MPNFTRDLHVEQGSDFTDWFPFENEQGQARAVVGWSAIGEVRHDVRGGLLYALPIRLTSGRVTVTVPGADSADWTWLRARYEIVLFGPDQRIRHASGEIVVDPMFVQGAPA